MASLLSLLFVVLSVQQTSCNRVQVIDRHSFEENKTEDANWVLEPPAPRWQGYEYVGYPPPQGTNPPGQPGTNKPYPRGRQAQTPTPAGRVAIDLTARKVRQFIFGSRAGFPGQFQFLDNYPAGAFQGFLQHLGVPPAETVAMLNELGAKTAINSFFGGSMEEQNQAGKQVVHEYKTKWHSEGKLQGYEVVFWTWRFQYEEMPPCRGMASENMGQSSFDNMGGQSTDCLEQYDWDHHVVVRPLSMQGHYLEGTNFYNRWCCCKPGTDDCKMKYEKAKTKCDTGIISTTHKELQADADFAKCPIPDVEPLPKKKSFSGLGERCKRTGGCFVAAKED